MVLGFCGLTRAVQLCPLLYTPHNLCSWNRGTPKGGGGGLQGCSPPNPQNWNFKNKYFVDIVLWYQNVYIHFPFSRNQPLKSADDKYIGLLKNKLIKLKKEDRTLWLSHGTCTYILMYVNAVADSVMLYLQHVFYNRIYKTKYKLYIASGSSTPPPKKTIWLRTWAERALLNDGTIFKHSYSMLHNLYSSKIIFKNVIIYHSHTSL
jgi:hypothetical protein